MKKKTRNFEKGGKRPGGFEDFDNPKPRKKHSLNPVKPKRLRSNEFYFDEEE